MSYRYGIIGAGRQGVAAAYDLAVRGEASGIDFADTEAERSRRAAQLISRLAPDVTVGHHRLDASDFDQSTQFMADKDAVLGSATWRLNVGLTDAAIATGTSFADLGGNSEVVLAQLERDHAARRAEVTVVPDCGQVPGTGANLLALVAGRFDQADSVILYDGGIPVDPEPPWNYRLTFNIDGLTNEYWGHAHYIVEGELRQVEVFEPSEYETLQFEGLGTLEAFPTSGGLTTLSRTLRGKVRTLKNKTLRYPGHMCQFKAFRDAGLFEETPIEVDGAMVVPRHVFHTLIEPKIRAGEAFRDVIVNRVIGTGILEGKPRRITLDVITYPPDDLPFTAMQTATGWHAAIILHRLASSSCPPGVIGVENAIDGDDLLNELRRRGYHIEERVEILA